MLMRSICYANAGVAQMGSAEIYRPGVSAERLLFSRGTLHFLLADICDRGCSSGKQRIFFIFHRCLYCDRIEFIVGMDADI